MMKFNYKSKTSLYPEFGWSEELNFKQIQEVYCHGF